MQGNYYTTTAPMFMYSHIIIVSLNLGRDCKEAPLTGKCTDTLLQEQLYRASLKWTKQEPESDKVDEHKEETKSSPSKSDGDKKGQSSHSKMERVRL